jgi:hypothetical protein
VLSIVSCVSSVGLCGVTCTVSFGQHLSIPGAMLHT